MFWHHGADSEMFSLQNHRHGLIFLTWSLHEDPRGPEQNPKVTALGLLFAQHLSLPCTMPKYTVKDKASKAQALSLQSKPNSAEVQSADLQVADPN